MSNITTYHAKYFAFELTKKSPSDSMQKFASTLVDAQVDLNPHQVDAALFAFRSPLSKGAILADEVGLGKTIEAGLVISQKWAERKRKILIITPASLRKQWSQELKDKFFLNSIILEAKSFNEIINRGNLNPFNQHDIVICSYQFAKTKEPYIRLINWDLSVIDEAHRLRNVYKSNNKIARSIKNSLESVPKILLTATPLQNTLLELYGLVSVIDDYAFGDLKSFKSQYSRVGGSSEEDLFYELKERLKPICKRTLRRQVLEYIRYTNRIALVEEFYPTAEEQELYDLVTEYLQRESLYALPSGQRKLMTLILRRLLASSTYAISGTLEALSTKLEHIVKDNGDNDNSEDISDNFEMYDELQEEWEGEDYDSDEERDEDMEHYSPYEIEQIKAEILSLKKFAKLAKSIIINSKGEKLFTALQRGFDEMGRISAPRKAIIFTESTRTQKYVRSLLESSGYSGKIVLFNGTNTDDISKKVYNDWIAKNKNTDKITGSKSADMRAALVDYFRDEATIMIATEAAAEGINLQFCSMIINYDLPWNPQRIEQRIGRCHRYGQKHDVVVINFLNKANAADIRVYELLNDKFNLFNGVFGASDEVLGSIENGVDFEKRIARIYQECRTQEQIQVAFNELQSELEESISTAMQNTRQKLLENFDEEVHEKLRINLIQSKEYLNKYESWLWDITKFALDDFAEFDRDRYSFTLKKNPFEGVKITSGTYKIGKNVQESYVYRIGHPLAQKIIEKYRSIKLPSSELTFDYSGANKKISVLESLVGDSGYLIGKQIRVSTFDTEEYVELFAVTSKGEVLSKDVAERFFSLPADVSDKPIFIPHILKTELDKTIESTKLQIVGDIETRNSEFFDIELDKLDKWGEDRRNSLRQTLKDLDVQIKELKKQARYSSNLPEKLKVEKERKKLENERDNAWREFDSAAKLIEESKDKLIAQIELRLQQKISEEDLFIVKWNII